VGSGVGSDGYVTYSNNLAGTLGAQMVIPGRNLVGSDLNGNAMLDPKLNWTDFIASFDPDRSKGEDTGAP